MKRPGDTTPDPPGGRAAERLRDQMQGRFPEGVPDESSPLPADEIDNEPEAEDGGVCRETNE